MSVVLDRVEIKLNAEQLVAAIRQLPVLEQAAVRKALDMSDAEWRQRFDRLLKTIRARVAADPNPITDEEITAEVEAVRAEDYAQGRHRYKPVD